jgi:hypothetical protein
VAKFEYAFLYPTVGLAVGNIVHPDWACVVARAYNNWIHDRYMKRSPRLKGMALIPMQDVSEAVNELRRAVNELGIPGAMLPSRLAFQSWPSHYWPIYADAEKLGCALAVHGGCHHGMGLDTFETFVPIHGLSHPLSLIIALSGMLYHGVFDEFPRLRVGFLEGGAGWAFWDGSDGSLASLLRRAKPGTADFVFQRRQFHDCRRRIWDNVTFARQYLWSYCRAFCSIRRRRSWQPKSTAARSPTPVTTCRAQPL